jgi:hypothetical protein
MNPLHAQDFLYMLQICIAFGALISVLLVFRYETLDRYADNRKEALREMLDIRTSPDRAEWIQRIGKDKTANQKLYALGIPSVESFIKEIEGFRSIRRDLVVKGELVAD